MLRKLFGLFFIGLLMLTAVAAEAGPFRALRGSGNGGHRATEDRGQAEQGKPLTNVENTSGNYDKLADVAYGNDIMQKLDIYLPRDGKSSRPLMIYVHGGGWRIGDKARVNEKEKYFTDRGYVFASINYRLSPKKGSSDPNRIMYPIHQQDVAAAIALLLKNAKQYGIDTSRVALMGHSAGCQIATLVATDGHFLQAHGYDTSAIKVLIALDTEGYNILSRMADAPQKARLMYTNAFGNNPKIWAEASATNYITPGKKLPTSLFIHQSRNKKLDSSAKEMVQLMMVPGIEQKFMRLILIMKELIKRRVLKEPI